MFLGMDIEFFKCGFWRFDHPEPGAIYSIRLERRQTSLRQTSPKLGQKNPDGWIEKTCIFDFGLNCPFETTLGVQRTD